MQLEIPNNVIVTWSLNPQIIIDHEEKNTASLEQRLRAAEKIRDKGTLVGFHFHPMVYFKDCKSEYLSIAQEIIKRFSSSELAMISMGVITSYSIHYTKLYEESGIGARHSPSPDPPSYTV